jgi:hypothetical protein
MKKPHSVNREAFFAWLSANYVIPFALILSSRLAAFDSICRKNFAGNTRLAIAFQDQAKKGPGLRPAPSSG